MLEACHIIPYSECNEDKDKLKFDINNGIILDRNTHKLFDDYKLSINPQTKKVEIIDEIKDYGKYNNAEIRCLNKGTLKNLETHYKKFKENEKMKENITKN